MTRHLLGCNLDVAGKTGGEVFLVENSFVNLFSSKNHPKKKYRSTK